jgi:hypothetical protein
MIRRHPVRGLYSSSILYLSFYGEVPPCNPGVIYYNQDNLAKLYPVLHMVTLSDTRVYFSVLFALIKSTSSGRKCVMNGSLKVIMVVLGLALIVGAVSADTVSARAGHVTGHAQVVRLVEKNSSDWSIVPGAFGSVMYQRDRFVFNGHRLVPRMNYSLISYAEPWPGTGSVVLGTGTATKQGNLHIKGGAVKLACNNYSAFTTGDYRKGNGSKIWLVLADDIDAVTGTFNAWHPDDYLFEKKLINTKCIAPN